ncbi:MAG TPA: NAD(P)H-binding protein [Thermoanaerobaculia bacterium]|nr:NAD(P)H-binding protein [Thermoanaerobaculia bacterium]
MKVLVTGGSGVIGNGVIAELLRRGHAVRLLSRHANDDAQQWPNDVEPFDGNVGDAASLHGSAAGCDAVLHIAGIASEEPPDVTFEKVNVGGTRNIVAEAMRGSAKRFVFVSSLGADRGTSDYHRSKLAAEKIVQQSALDWLIVRPGGVYGPGDEVTSQILKLVRALPALPVIDDGEQPFQPIWFEDLGKALATAIERTDLTHRILDLAGEETTSMNDLIRRLGELTGRKTAKVPVPMPLANLAVKLGAKAGVALPTDETKLAMLADENVVTGENSLELLGVNATPLDRGLRALADAIPESLPNQGIGAMHHKRYWADIETRHTAQSLMTLIRDRAAEIIPIEFEAEPGTPQRLDFGVTLTAHLPLRGNIQVRVELIEATRVVLSTIEGHPLAGVLQFSTESIDGGVRFVVEHWTRAANLFDLIGMKTVGQPLQDANWRRVVQNVIDASGGTANEGVKSSSRTLDNEEAARIEERAKQMVQARKRNAGVPPAGQPASRRPQAPLAGGTAADQRAGRPRSKR